MLFSCQSVFAISANDAKTYAEREPQRKAYANAVAQASEKNLNAIRSSANGVNKTIQQQINNYPSTIPDGSKVTGGGSVTKPINTSAVAKTMAKRLEKAKALGKASLPSFLGSAALTGLINAVGWVMDEGGQIHRPDPTISPDDPSVQYFWAVSLHSSMKKHLTPESVCRERIGGVIYVYSHVVVNDAKSFCYAIKVADNKVVFYEEHTRYKNPLYNPSAPVPALVPASSQDIENKINNYITNNTTNNITNNIVNNSYSYDSSNGATPSDDTNALANEGHKDISNAIDKASTAPYNESNPTKGYYKITDGEKTIEGYVNNPNTSGSTNTETESTTTKNPDGSETTTGSETSETTLPAFCDWASIVCDWIDWTKDDSDLPEKDDTDLNTVVDFEEKKVSLNVSAQCPLPVYETVSFHGVTTQVKVTDYSYICQLDWLIKPFVIGFAMVSASFILFGFHRGDD